VLEIFPRHVDARLADEGDDDTDVRDGHFGHVHHLDGREPRVDEVAAGQQHLLLQSLAALAVDEGLGILKHAVTRDDGAGDLAGGQRAALARGDYAHLVVRDVDRVRQRHGEQERVDAVGARSDDGRLGPAFAAAGDEGGSILERIAVHPPRDDAATRQCPTVPCLEHAHLARRHHDGIAKRHLE
jgi:hypothetical protein